MQAGLDSDIVRSAQQIIRLGQGRLALQNPTYLQPTHWKAEILGGPALLSRSRLLDFGIGAAYQRNFPRVLSTISPLSLLQTSLLIRLSYYCSSPSIYTSAQSLRILFPSLGASSQDVHRAATRSPRGSHFSPLRGATGWQRGVRPHARASSQRGMTRAHRRRHLPQPKVAGVRAGMPAAGQRQASSASWRPGDASPALPDEGPIRVATLGRERPSACSRRFPPRGGISAKEQGPVGLCLSRTAAALRSCRSCRSVDPPGERHWAALVAPV